MNKFQPTLVRRRRVLGVFSGLSFGLFATGSHAAAAGISDGPIVLAHPQSNPVSVTVSDGVAVSAKSTSTAPGDHVGVFNLAADGGPNNAGLNVDSADAAFSAAEVTRW